MKNETNQRTLLWDSNWPVLLETLDISLGCKCLSNVKGGKLGDGALFIHIKSRVQNNVFSKWPSVPEAMAIVQTNKGADGQNQF